MISQTLDMILTFVVLGFWVAFPIGLYLTLGSLGRDTRGIVRLEHLSEANNDDLKPALARSRVKPRVKWQPIHH